MREDRGAHIPFLFIDTTRNCCNVTEFWCAQRAFVQPTSKSVMRDKSFSFWKNETLSLSQSFENEQRALKWSVRQNVEERNRYSFFPLFPETRGLTFICIWSTHFLFVFCQSKEEGGNSESCKSISNHNWITVMKFSSWSIDNSSGKEPEYRNAILMALTNERGIFIPWGEKPSCFIRLHEEKC